MDAAQWELFVGIAVLVTFALLMLARVTQRTLSPPVDPAVASDPATDEYSFTTGVLLVNVALSHGLFGGILLVAAWYARIPIAALGVQVDGRTFLLALGLGVILYGVNEVAAGIAKRWGVEHAEELRELLAPDSVVGWVVLLGVVLPVIAGVEELLFRAALIGVPAAGFGVSPWGLAVVSSVAFGLGHGLQGPGGIVVTGLLGFALAVAFIVTGSLVAVIIAHYVVNALEFVVHEGLGIEPFHRLGEPG